jgi:hypothetical protein
MLPENDAEFLVEKGYAYRVSVEGGVAHLVIASFPFPATYAPTTADLLIRLLPGYPGSQLDMFWTSPDVLLVAGGFPQACAHKETYLGKSWQRWSRHWQAPWRPGVDCLQTYIAAINHELAKGI